MDPKRYQKVKEVLLAALERPPADRDSFLSVACGEDSDLRNEVEALLAEDSDPSPQVLDAPRALQAQLLGAVHGLTPPSESEDDELDRLFPGQPIDQFELIRELGRGGMGRIFLARDTKLGRKVALKFLSLRSPELMDRFLTEAKVTAQCQHENIVIIHQVGEAHGLPYLALEYLDGDPLSALLAEHPLPPSRVLEIALPVARALVVAHKQGIVHRDLKPENIFVTRSGWVKVLDFGIAKLLDHAEQRWSEETETNDPNHGTQAGVLVGTLPYMSPEQWGLSDIDHRTDLWSLGIILWRLLAGKHPVEPLTIDTLRASAHALDDPLPSIEIVVPSISPELAALVDTCLAKKKSLRPITAQEIVNRIESLGGARVGLQLGQDQSPFPGLAAFQGSDASRFFGREHETEALVRKLREQPLLAVAGPSGVGKSSFVRAGVIPALRRAPEPWEVFITRPGRNALAGLASMVRPLIKSVRADLRSDMGSHEAFVQRLADEPGYLGTLLRSRAHQKDGHVLVFVDQFEELYTLCSDHRDHLAFTQCLRALADDPSSPVRLLLSIRSDLLDRLAPDREFMASVSSGLIFLPPLDPPSMRSVLVNPLAEVGYAFESESLLEEMLSSFNENPDSLPLLQFTAAKLWEQRDTVRRMLTEKSYQALGGVGGTLSVHGDAVLSSLDSEQQKLAQRILRRLVTPNRTRALVGVEELQHLGTSPEHVHGLLDILVGGRLLVTHRGPTGKSAVELVHDSLIEHWGTLQRWVGERAEHRQIVEQLRLAAHQWQEKDRPDGLLWDGDAAEEIHRVRNSINDELTTIENGFLKAVEAKRTRSLRRRRGLIVGSLMSMAALALAAIGTVIWIRGAEQEAQAQRKRAEQEADRARTAEKHVRTQLETIQAQREHITVAERQRREATQTAKAAEQQKQWTYEQLEDALKKMRGLANAEHKARQRAEQLSREKQERIKKLEKELKTLASDLD